MSSPTAAAQPRKFPPPCWTDDEAQPLISVFKQKWTSLNRTNLKSHDWDAVAACLAAQFPSVSPSKTYVFKQKWTSLNRTIFFRSEQHRASTRPGRFSPWALYPFMQDLESAKPAKPGPITPAFLGEFVTTDPPSFPVKSLGHRNLGGSGGVLRSGGREAVDPAEEIVSSIRLLGEKYMKVEKRKMEMAREIVMMQMDMEMKQTRVVMESQQQMVDACVTALLESKKKKKRKVGTAVPADS